MRTAIITDSNSGIFEQEGQRMGAFVIPMPVILDGSTYYEGKDITHDEFFRYLSEQKPVSTSQPSITDVLQSKFIALQFGQNFDCKGTYVMNSDTRTYVVNLLESYQERQRKIALLHYELEHPAHISETEMIRTMALGHGDNSGSGHPEGRVSDKTLYIALNYRSKADKMNADTKEEIVVQLVELEEDQKRLEYYISLLREREASVLRMIYLNGVPLEEIASQIGVVLRTVRKIRERAIDELVKMYDFTGKQK